MLDAALLWADKNKKRFLGDLQQWLAIPSVSAQAAHKDDVRAAAEWAMFYLRTLGMQARLVDTPGHPCVLATTPDALCPKDAPHVLLYGHYDVQPPEPMDLWTSPPFAGEVRNNAIIARGACDDKGQVHCHMAALTCWKEINEGFPCRVTVLLEGEEEVGSPNLMGVVNAHKDLLASARTLIISDSAQFARGLPAITYGLRGLVYFQLRVKGANTDLHSGQYGGAVANPAHVLVDILGKLHDAQGRIAVPGFYDDVLPLTDEERAAWQKLPFSDDKMKAELGIGDTFGEAGYSTLERKWGRPTLEINGLTSGYQGPGAKTVLPNEASAKVSCRLVPNQDPRDIAHKLETYLNTLANPYGNAVTLEVQELGAGSPAGLTPMDSPAMQAAAEALEIGMGHRPVLIREGGSIPVVSWFKQALNLDTVMVGFGLPDDRIHAPNEKLELDCYYGGIKTAVALYDKLAERLK